MNNQRLSPNTTNTAGGPQNVTAETVAVQLEPSVTSADTPDIPRVGAWFTTVFTLTYFGFFLVLFMPALFSLAYKVQLIDPATKEANLGLIIGIGGFVSLVAGPILGVLSDATRSRWGRRRPYLVAGFVLSLISALIIAVAPNFWVVLAGWVVAQFGGSSISAALNPTLAERVPEFQRGRLGSLSGLAASVAGVAASLAGSFLTGNLLLLFLAPVAVFAVTATLWMITVPDASAPKDARIGSIGGLFRSLAFNPRKHQDFAWVWLGKFILNIGFAFFSTYQFYFLLDRMGLTPEGVGQQLAAVGGISLLSTMLFTLGGGYLSDKLRRRKPFIYIAAAMIAAGSITVGISTDITTYVVGAVVMSGGIGAFNSVDLALAADVVPQDNENGKWMGIYFLSGSLASTVGPVLAPLVLAIGGATSNYTVLFITGGVLALGGAITATRVRGVR